MQGKRGLSPDIVFEHSLEYLQNRHSGVVIQVERLHIWSYVRRIFDKNLYKLYILKYVSKSLFNYCKSKVNIPDLVGLRQKLPVNGLCYSLFDKPDILEMPES